MGFQHSPAVDLAAALIWVVTGCVGPKIEDDLNLVQLFLHNVSIAYENALLRDEIEGTQRDMVYMLGESIETRSRATGQHVRRGAEYCRLIALGIGLWEREAEILHIASPLHDFGKIGIPDAILHKPGKLEPDEWSVMQTHATVGRDMLARSKREILQAAALLAGQHHERWDGTGYPNGLAGETIHIYGRIGAVADWPRRHWVIVEGAGALPLAAALTGKAGPGPIVAIVSGGNIDLAAFAELNAEKA